MGELSLFPFHLFIQLLNYISMDLCVFGLLNLSNTLPSFFFPAQIILILATESHFKLAPMFIMTYFHYFLRPSHFLTSKNVPHSSWFFYAPAMESAVASRSLSSFNRRIM